MHKPSKLADEHPDAYIVGWYLGFRGDEVTDEVVRMCRNRRARRAFNLGLSRARLDDTLPVRIHDVRFPGTGWISVG